MSAAIAISGSRSIIQIAEDAAFLWLWRDVAARAPNIRLIDLVRRDERLDAHGDALGVAGEKGWQLVCAELPVAGAGAVFSAFSQAMTPFIPERVEHVVNIATANDAASGTRAGISALARAERSSVAEAIAWMAHQADPLRRGVAIGALGARRSDPGAAVVAALADGSLLVRARAYRATGQLGRADLMAQLRPGLTDPDPECRFWSAWAAARMGATEPLDILADIAWNNLHRADRALDLLLRRFNVPQANAWLREFAKLPDRQRALIRATGVIGDPLYIPWLIEHMATPATARLAGESLSMITGLDLAYRDLDRRPPADFQSGPNDDPADENVSLDEDENLPWPDPERIGQWWTANRSRFSAGTAYFLGTPKVSADWLEALSDAFQRQRHAAALELAIRQPDKAMFEVRARGRLQRQLIARARGLA